MFSPYRESAAVRERPSLGIGRMPEPADFLAIAYLRWRREGIAQTLIGAGLAAGWLRADGDRYRFDPSAEPGPIGESLHAALLASGRTEFDGRSLRRRARAAAARREAVVLRELARAGMVRWDGRKAAVALAGLLLGALAPASGLWLLVVPALAVLLRSPLTAHGRAYLQWLARATTPLQNEVHRGRRREVTEVSLALATAGAGVSGPLLAPLWPLWLRG